MRSVGLGSRFGADGVWWDAVAIADLWEPFWLGVAVATPDLRSLSLRSPRRLSAIVPPRADRIPEVAVAPPVADDVQDGSVTPSTCTGSDGPRFAKCA